MGRGLPIRLPEPRAPLGAHEQETELVLKPVAPVGSAMVGQPSGDRVLDLGLAFGADWAAIPAAATRAPEQSRLIRELVGARLIECDVRL
jgi:hypothetical protein